MVSRIGLAMMSHGDPGSQRRARREDDAGPVIRHAAIGASPSRQHGMGHLGHVEKQMVRLVGETVWLHSSPT